MLPYFSSFSHPALDLLVNPVEWTITNIYWAFKMELIHCLSSYNVLRVEQLFPFFLQVWVIINGSNYSGYFPKHYMTILTKCSRENPSQHTVGQTFRFMASETVCGLSVEAYCGK